MYAGNASIVNFLMRWPVLVPIIGAVIAAPMVIDPKPPAPPEPKVAIAPPVVTPVPAPVVVPPAPLPPVVVPPPTPRKVEELCPPVKDTAKLKKAEKDSLRARGCKVAG